MRPELDADEAALSASHPGTGQRGDGVRGGWVTRSTGALGGVAERLEGNHETLGESVSEARGVLAGARERRGGRTLVPAHARRLRAPR